TAADVTGAPTAMWLASETVNVTVPPSTGPLGLVIVAVSVTVCGAALKAAVAFAAAVVEPAGAIVSVRVASLLVAKFVDALYTAVIVSVCAGVPPGSVNAPPA